MNGPSVDSGLARVPYFYCEDVVRHEKSGSVGVVKYDAGGSTRVRVMWLDGTEETEHANDITLVDRPFFPGEYVASVTDPTGQIGVVQDVNVSTDLLAPDGSILRHVSPRGLEPVMEFYAGEYVVLGSWVGRIYHVLDIVTVLTDDGSSCKLVRPDPLHLKPESKYHMDKYGHYPYYPGQRVRASSASVFKRSRWLSDLWEANSLEGTVTRVTVRSLFINWIASAVYGSNSSAAPSKKQRPKNVKLLPCSNHAYWEVGDWFLLPPPLVLLSSSSTPGLQDNGCKLEEGTLHQVKEPVDLDQVGATNANGKRNKENFEKGYMIINTSRKFDVLWQDGTIGHGIDSKLLSLNGHELVAQQYVVESASDDISETRRSGLIQSVNAKERTACVRWSKPGEDPREFEMGEIVSVYELQSHPDYGYKYGAVVFRLSPYAVSDGKDPRTEKHSGGEIPPGEAFTALSLVGNVTGLKNGDIEVTWADGMVSTVGPQEICGVKRDSAYHNKSIDIEFARNPARSLLLDAIDFVKQLGATFFSWGKNVDDFLQELQGQGTTNIFEGRKVEESADVEAQLTSSIVSEEGSRNLETERIEVAAALNSDGNTPHFKPFDTANDPLDHHFLGTSGQVQVSNGRKWPKKVQQDWSMLRDNLPDGIYVRVYEDRMDLIRAVVVGPYGTPYQDGLFLFDFYLPPDYPDVPPSAYYHSGGWRINPNLYEEGKVCLSILNTWSGNKNEVWDPTSSSFLQVLVSLQSLVLTSRPYFNEPGYDKQVGSAEGEKNSLSYDENTFLLSCKTMMYLMRRPPKDFEELIKDNFKRRGWHILKACDAYMRGSLIGSLSRDVSAGMEETLNSTSVGFKLMMAKIMPKLYSALSEVGADCAEFKHLVSGGK